MPTGNLAICRQRRGLSGSGAGARPLCSPAGHETEGIIQMGERERRPRRAFGAVRIKERCGECDQRPIAVASWPDGPAEMILAWACDDHIDETRGIHPRAGGRSNSPHVRDLADVQGVRSWGFAVRCRRRLPRSPSRRRVCGHGLQAPLSGGSVVMAAPLTFRRSRSTIRDDPWNTPLLPARLRGD
jgi:hypothetical protein